MFSLLFFVSSLLLVETLGLISHGLDAAAWRRARCGPNDLLTQWSALVNSSVTPLPEYPRPQAIRVGLPWASLHGLWRFAIAHGPAEPSPAPVLPADAGTILVPFPPESCLSGVGAFEDYPRSTPNFTWTVSSLDFDAPAGWPSDGAETLLHIEACDWNCSVFFNGALVSTHQGGYSPFSTSVPLQKKNNSLVVFAHDPTERGSQPQGKQLTLDILGVHVDGNKYTPTSGIWGEVWLEAVPAVAYISDLRLRANASAVFVGADIAGATAPGCALALNVSLAGAFVVAGTVPCAAAAGGSFAAFAIPAPVQWAPGSPVLYDLDITLLADGSVAGDTMRAYFGLRSVGLRQYTSPGEAATGPLANTSLGGAGAGTRVKAPHAAACSAACTSAGTTVCAAWQFAHAAAVCRLKAGKALPLLPLSPGYSAGRAATPPAPAARPTLSGNFTFATAWLDQSFWPDGAYRAPTDAALAADLTAALALGFNAVRVHTKVNSRRFYHHADLLGVMLLQDFVQKFAGEGLPLTAASVPLFLADARALIDSRGSSPAIVQWNIFNEGDCVDAFNASAVTDWVAAYDGLASPHGAVGAARLVDTNSGGPANAVGVGDLFDVHSYPAPAAPLPSTSQAAMVGEFAGLGWFPPAANTWRPGTCYAYQELASPAAFADLYCAYLGVLDVARVSRAVATQATDLESECDGFYNYDRTPKFNATQVAQLRACHAAVIARAGL